MNVMVFDTETTSIEKPFCYNVGFVIGNTETGEILLKKEFVIEQIWHNLELFSSAYYAEKRPIYVNRMRGRKISLEKWGYVMRGMYRIIKDFDISAAYAFNSPFDEKVFSFCCDWFKTSNPFDLIPVFDIRSYLHNKIAWSNEYQTFCETNHQFTESGNYSTTAETAFRFFSKQFNFQEEHTALADSEIEWEVLKECVKNGCEWNTKYKVYNSIPRKVEKVLTIIDQKENKKFIFKGEKITIKKSEMKVIIK